VIFEYLRGYLFSGFGWASLGYCQYRNLNFIQIASFTGAYGVSFLIVAVNVLIKEFILNIKSILFFNRTYLKKFAYILLTVFILLLSVYIYGDIVLNRKTKGKKITVSVIQGNIPQQQKWEAFYRDLILEKYVRLTEMASFDQPDVIIWPETSVPGYLQEEDLLRQLSDLAKTTESPLLVGAVTMDEKNKKFYNSAALFSKQGVLTKVYDKIHLVPFGEYVPAPYIFSFSKDWVQSFDFSSGTAYTLFSVKGAKFGVLICFEDVFPNLVRNFVNQGADFMVNITNDAWFMQSVEPYQHLQASVFRAIENRINIARAANTGISCFVDPQGHIAERISFNDKDIFIEGFATQTIVINNKKSFYSKFGDVFVLLTSIALVFSVLIDFLKK
jgi:apolipoprotein N-acyltransferase